jgi:hypothetical protein
MVAKGGGSSAVDRMGDSRTPTAITTPTMFMMTPPVEDALLFGQDKPPRVRVLIAVVQQPWNLPSGSSEL